jgi:hypothetical protein
MDPIFVGVVLGYLGFGMSGCGAVLVELDKGQKDTKAPASWRRLPRGLERKSDGYKTKRLTLACVGDWRPCRDVAEALKGQRVEVGLDEMGLFPVFKPLD